MRLDQLSADDRDALYDEATPGVRASKSVTRAAGRVPAGATKAGLHRHHTLHAGRARAELTRTSRALRELTRGY